MLYSADYFPRMYELAERLVLEGKAYVDDSTDEQIKEMRGTLTEPGTPSPNRDRTPEENLALLRKMKAGDFPDGACVLRNATSAAVDFVKWRAANGTANTTPVPSGTAFAGDLDSPAFGANLRRNIHGADTDVAADFTAGSPMLGAVNHPAAIRRTLYPAADQDVFAVTVVAGQRYGFEARGPYSATDPRLELLAVGTREAARMRQLQSDQQVVGRAEPLAMGCQQLIQQRRQPGFVLRCGERLIRIGAAVGLDGGRFASPN